MFISLSYVDKRVLWYSFGASMVMCAVTFICVWRYPPYPTTENTAPSHMTMITVVVLLMLCFFVARTILERQTELVRAILEAVSNSKKDALTGLFNHNAFYDTLEQNMREAKNNGNIFSVILMDIDDFKLINDQYGHYTGDDLIRLCVKAIQQNLEKRDTAFRYGGEEFTVLTHKGTNSSYELAEKIRRAFASKATKSGFNVTISAGVCQYDTTLFTAERDYFTSVDEALYEAKSSGKNKTVVYKPAAGGKSTLKE
ncbi:MAG: GGDEF domain-containing protein [Oscillospiraceae bacterium]